MTTSENDISGNEDTGRRALLSTVKLRAVEAIHHIDSAVRETESTLQAVSIDKFDEEHPGAGAEMRSAVKSLKRARAHYEALERIVDEATRS